MTDSALDLAVGTEQRELRIGMIETSFEGCAVDSLPAPGVVTCIACARHDAFVDVVVTGLASSERKVHILRRGRPTLPAHRLVAFLASNLPMATGEPKPSCTVIECLGFIPCRGLMAFLASAGSKLSAVRILGPVTLRTSRAEAEQRLPERSVLALEGAHIRSGDQCLRMTIPAARLAMSPLECETRFGMIEGGRIEPHDLKIDTEVIFVTLGAVVITDRRVVARMLLNAVSERRVTGQALVVRSASLPEVMTLGAVANALEIMMGCG